MLQYQSQNFDGGGVQTYSSALEKTQSYNYGG